LTKTPEGENIKFTTTLILVQTSCCVITREHIRFHGLCESNIK